MKKVNPLAFFSIFSLFGIYGLLTNPGDLSKLSYLIYLLYLWYLTETPDKTFYQEIQKAAAISFFIVLFAASISLVIVYFSAIGYGFIESSFWIISTSMTAILSGVYAWIKDDRKRREKKASQTSS